jgi:hypothetical protein
MKTIGCKINDKIYQKFKDLNRPLSESLREAIFMYLNNSDYVDKKVNHIETPVNHVNQSKTAQSIDYPSKYSNNLYEEYKKQKNRTTNQSYLSKYNEINKKLLHENEVNFYVNKFPRKPYSKRKYTSGNYLKDRPTSGTSSTSLFRCPYCGQMIRKKIRYRRTGMLFCPYCKRSLYL